MLELRSPINEATHVRPDVLAADLARGVPAIVDGLYVFGVINYTTSDANPDLIGAAPRVEVDAEALAYNIGDLVYDDSTTPTGTVNKTSGAGRIVVGKVIEETDLTGGPGKLLIRFNGGAGPTEA